MFRSDSLNTHIGGKDAREIGVFQRRDSWVKGLYLLVLESLEPRTKAG